jgi:EAL domain-containing protein (putative c-di-GMP-specific phosphodiesterase class I)
MVVAVNFSARQFRHVRLEESIAAILYETKLSPQCLGIELTESLVMQNAEAGALTLAKLKRMGMKISIDDFGTGYSSLSYLKRFPIDEIKIDQSFVHGVMNDPDDAVICKAVIALAHGLGLKVIAEGVETDRHLAFLRAYGCDKAQGYLFSRPLSPQKFSEFARNHDFSAFMPGTLNTKR